MGKKYRAIFAGTFMITARRWRECFFRWAPIEYTTSIGNKK